MPISFAVNDNLEYSGARFMSSPTIAGAAAFEAGNPAAQAAIGAIADTATSMFNFLQVKLLSKEQALNLLDCELVNL